ncbi:MAG TPA: D-alanyl-D-alanine carboxypeptidase family protein [Verrucomicrobiae bacterium]
MCIQTTDKQAPEGRVLEGCAKVPWLLILLSLVLAGFLPVANAASSKSKAGSTTNRRSYTIAQNPYVGAIVVNVANGAVLFEDRADTKGYPASVLKLMDLLIILEKIEQGQLSLQDKVPVSRKATMAGTSKVWLTERESFTLEEMLYALMVHSANDVAVALAEKVAGSTDAFVDLMNAKARALGMKDTEFHSVHGLPPARGEKDDITTARDLSILCREVLKHPQALRYTTTRTRVFRPNAGKRTMNMQNHNPLLGKVEGCDGLKTGYIAKAGFSIAVTAWRNGQRVIVIVLGSTERKLRDAKAIELVDKGFTRLSGSPAPANRAKSTSRRTAR